MNNGLPKGVQPTGGGPEKGPATPAQLPVQDNTRPLGPLPSPLAEPGTPTVRRTPPPGQTRPVSDLVLPQAASTPGDEPRRDATDPTDGQTQPAPDADETRKDPPINPPPPGGPPAEMSEPEPSQPTQKERIRELLSETLLPDDRNRFLAEANPDREVLTLDPEILPHRPPELIPTPSETEAEAVSGAEQPTTYEVVVPVTSPLRDDNLLEIPPSDSIVYVSLQGTDLKIEGLAETPPGDYPQATASIVLQATTGQVRVPCRILPDLQLVLEPSATTESMRGLFTVGGMQDEPQRFIDALHAAAPRQQTTPPTPEPDDETSQVATRRNFPASTADEPSPVAGINGTVDNSPTRRSDYATEIRFSDGTTSKLLSRTPDEIHADLSRRANEVAVEISPDARPYDYRAAIAGSIDRKIGTTVQNVIASRLADSDPAVVGVALKDLMILHAQTLVSTVDWFARRYGLPDSQKNDLMRIAVDGVNEGRDSIISGNTRKFAIMRDVAINALRQQVPVTEVVNVAPRRRPSALVSRGIETTPELIGRIVDLARVQGTTLSDIASAIGISDATPRELKALGAIVAEARLLDTSLPSRLPLSPQRQPEGRGLNVKGRETRERITTTRTHLESTLGRTPTPDEIAVESSIPLRTVQGHLKAEREEIAASETPPALAPQSVPIARDIMQTLFRFPLADDATIMTNLPADLQVSPALFNQLMERLRAARITPDTIVGRVTPEQREIIFDFLIAGMDFSAVQAKHGVDRRQYWLNQQVSGLRTEKGYPLPRATQQRRTTR